MREAIRTRPDDITPRKEGNFAALTTPEKACWPHLNVVFATPGVVADDETVAINITSSDAIVFGTLHPDHKIMDMISKVSNGEISPVQAANHRLFRQDDDMQASMHAYLTPLYGSEKPVFFLGADTSHPISRILDRTDSPNAPIFTAKFLLTHDFPELIQETQNYFSSFGQDQRQYMNLMAEQLRNLPSHPILQEVDISSAAVILPPLYRPIISKVTEYDIPFTTQATSPPSESFYYKAQEHAVWDNPISDELAAKTITEIWAAESYDPRSILEFIDGAPISGKDALAYGTAIAQALSFQEVEQVFHHFTSRKKIPFYRITNGISLGRFQEGLQTVFTAQAGGKLPQQLDTYMPIVVPPGDFTKLTL